MANVLVIGVTVVDFVFRIDALPKEPVKYRAQDAEIAGGGCAGNASVAIARLGGTAYLGARLGDDPVGDMILDDLRREGVDTRLVQRSTGARSSFSSVFVDAAGERQIVNFRGSGMSQETGWIADAPLVDAVLADTRWTEGAIAALELARARGVPGIVDAEKPMDHAVLKHASHVAFSRDGLLSFCGGDDLGGALTRAAERLDAWVCVTDGENGTLVADTGEVTHVPAFAVSAIDTTAAGDIWHGAFALFLAEGDTAVIAVRKANAAAALKCTAFGGRKGTPTKGELDKFLKVHR